MIAVFVLTAWGIVLAGCSAGGTESDAAKKLTKQIRSVQIVEDGIALVDAAGRDLMFPEPPDRIVSMIPADLEIIRALGGNIVGGPTGLGPFKEVGDAHNIDFEKVLSLRPELIVGHADLNAKDVGTIESLGIKMLLSKADSYEEIVATIHMYGLLLDRAEAAAELVKALEERKSALEPLKKSVKALIVFGSTESFKGRRAS